MLRELAQFAAAVDRGRGPPGPGTVVDNRGLFIEEKIRELFLEYIYSVVANFSRNANGTNVASTKLDAVFDALR